MTQGSAKSGAAGLIGMFFTAQFLKFLFVGTVAAAIHWLARYLMTPAMGYVPSLVVAYAIGMFVAFVLNAWLVFSDAKNERREQAAYFTIVNLMMAPVVIAISWIISEFIFPWIGWTLHPREIAHAIGVASPVFLSFIAHKFLTFKGA